MRAVVLAAGLGRRLAPFTEQIPKPLMPIANRPLLQYVIEGLARAGVTDLFVNVHHRPGAIEAVARDLADAHGMRLLVRTEPELTGPAGGVRCFLDRFDPGEQVVVVSGDCLTDMDFAALEETHRRAGASLTVTVTDVHDPGRYGVATIASDGTIAGFVEKPRRDPEIPAPVSCGVYCVNAALVADFPAIGLYDFGADLIPSMIERGQQVHAHRITDYWCDIGDQQAFQQSNFDMLAGRVRWAHASTGMAEGARAATTARLVPPFLIGDGVVIDDGAILEGPNVVGDGCRIGARAVVTRSILLPGAVVAADAVVRDMIVGPMGRVRT
jgi:NDP-sugar pyrophosphorylase family protein